MSALIPKAQEFMKGKPHDAQSEAFVNHLVEAFTAMKTKISKEVCYAYSRAPRETCSHSISPPFICFDPHRTFQASEASRVVLARVAAKCFKVADDTDRAGQATRETSKDFRKAVVMYVPVVRASRGPDLFSQQ